MTTQDEGIKSKGGQKDDKGGGVDKSVNQSVDQGASQSINKSVNQSID